ncbi:nSTAND1 domain-containing NTPase [Hymenobacter ruricola]|uniref:Novel STAND NTPase 1 domain-containing protein n=1 Tax=Hymenobacter ruricola TaxID=2791023 RepID=A0ABS0IA78_9BACT|nr:hypothetical protein [Hymenobacter ruricola]MBF9223871.1 hypothetical protein [Hymenobacter ruricola]
MDVNYAAASSLFGLGEPICPYTGLRTFTEEEAIYFRGREGHVGKCLALLAAERFVMITGASGDGKSSLVFAGLLPEVRAGFVRARHGTWAVATFRPERSPLHNLARALAEALGLPSSRSVETELGQGFSSLVQLYQTSALNPPAPDPALPAADQRRQQRQAANLLLVVDQFEEFFTNPENYEGGAPNAAAQTTVNLLLETARLAREQQLPIYVVCTMRSDFVGQCAEFRGLIEQVGASQYFVPRLLRHEFAQVIRDPAQLSGNRISERLVQRLLYDVGQGQDQLPVLQHALRRIWLAADEGREEMDLRHYAMVGGLSDELPEADRPRFEAWKAALPAHQQKFLLANPGLRNVLDAHANQLYFEANERYNQDFQPPLPPGTAERVIEQTFRVLTRTDGQRVVRNRVTGAQITAILDDASLPWPVVCRILRPFRAEGTTFLSPFLSEGEDDRAVLPPDAVLDISHESLIRNWNKLTEWAASEAKDVQIANDFTKQAGRWQESGENPGFLLPIGLYTFFSGWHANKKGADKWLAYYQQANPDASLKQGAAGAPVGVLTRYLATSRRHLWSQLLAARYGVWRLTAAILLPLVLLGGSIWWWKQRKMQSDYVAGALVEGGRATLSDYAQQMRHMAEERDRADSLLKRGNGLLESAKTRKDSASATLLVDQATKALQSSAAVLPAKDIARFILNADRLRSEVYLPLFSTRRADDYSFANMLSVLKDDTLALDAELSMYALVDNMKYDRVEKENPLISPVLDDLLLRLGQAGDIARPPGNASAAPTERQRRLAVLTGRTVMALSYYLACDTQCQVSIRPDSAEHRAVRKKLERSRAALLQKMRGYAKWEIETRTGTAPSPVAFGFCLRVLLGQGHDSATELQFLNGLSPLDTTSARQFNRFFPSDLGLYTQISENHTKFIPYGGGYLTVAMAFAALGNQAKVLQCLDTLRAQEGVPAIYRAYPSSADEYTFRDSAKTNSCLALVPYLIKYELLDANSTHGLLAKCAQASGLAFNEMYAAAVYSLLSVKPLPAVFDAGQDATSQISPNSRIFLSWGGQPARMGGVSLERLNADRVSFSLTEQARDKAWAALQGANATIANAETMFAGSTKPGRPTPAATANQYTVDCNKLFLDAFWAKTYGIYLKEIKQIPAESEQYFAQFTRSLQALQQRLRGGAPANQASRLSGNTKASQPRNAAKKRLAEPRIGSKVGTTQLGDDVQSATTFLQSSSRPEVWALENLALVAHYTCSFDAFFQYELEYQAKQENPDWQAVKLLDSTAFAEARMPYPNLVLIRAIAKTHVRGNAFREQRNLLLLTIEEAIRQKRESRGSDSAKSVANKLLNLNRQLLKIESSSGGFYGAHYRVAMDNALHEYALEVARGGNIVAAFAMADSIIATTSYTLPQMNYEHKIKISEQAMLTNSQYAHPVLDNFLAEYLSKTNAGVVTSEAEEDGVIFPSASILAVCFWRPFVDKSQLDTIPLVAHSLTYRLNKVPLTIGLNAPFKADGLADDVYKANEEITNSPFALGFTRFMFINQALLGYAHLVTKAPGNGWYEYDEEGLTLPADYFSFGD